GSLEKQTHRHELSPSRELSRSLHCAWGLRSYGRCTAAHGGVPPRGDFVAPRSVDRGARSRETASTTTQSRNAPMLTRSMIPTHGVESPVPTPRIVNDVRTPNTTMTSSVANE